MIIQADDEVIMGSGRETKKFSIATSAKAFKILSSGLYKNKIRAVVRELACNCMDAHVLNGFKGAFDIKVPSQLDPRFVIRDYGPGLDKDGVETLYTTYFASTKNNSNDFIGALGLGSKSPFSYTETFTVTSYHDGVVRGYTAMLDKGEPVIMPLFEEAMTAEDKTGIEIVVPVKKDDMQRWKEEIAYVLRPFGADKVNIQGSNLTVDFFPEFDEYLALGSQQYGHPERNGMYAVYGKIVYPLNDVPGLKDTWLLARHGLVYIRFPLGELDISASREELSLDEQTIQNIKTRIEALDKRVMDEDLKEWVNSSNIRKTARDIGNLGYSANQMIQKRATRFTTLKKTYRELENMFSVRNDWVNAGVVYEVYADPKLKRLKTSSNSASAGLNYMFGLQRERLTIVLDDDKKNRLPAIRALNSLFYSRDEKDVKLLKDNKKWLPKQAESLLFVDLENEHQVNMVPHWLKLFDGDEVNIIYTSELYNLVKHSIVVVPRDNSEPRPKTPTAYHHVYKDGAWQAEELFMTAKEVEDVASPVVFMFGSNIQMMDASFGTVYYLTDASLREMALSMGIKEFYKVRPTLHKKILKMDQCECLIKTVLERYIELIDEVDPSHYSGVTGRARSYTRHTDQYPELAFMINHFNVSGVTTDASIQLNAFNRCLRNITFANVSNKEWQDNIFLAQKIVQKLQQAASEAASDKVTKFEEENIIVSSFMRSCYDMQPEAIKEIVKLMGL